MRRLAILFALVAGLVLLYPASEHAPNPARAAVAIGVFDHKAAAGLSATTDAVTTQATGSVLVVFCAWFGDGGVTTFVSITDSKSNTYTQIGTQLGLASDQQSRAYYVENATGGASHTVTCTVSATQPITVFFVEITGALTSGALDVADRGADSATPWLSPGITTTQGDAILVGATFGEGPGGTINHTAGASFTKLNEETDANNFFPGVSMYRVVSSTGTYNTSTTTDNEGGLSQTAGWVAAFKAAGGAAPAVRTLLLLGVGGQP